MTLPAINHIWRVTIITCRRLARGLRIPGKRPEGVLLLSVAVLAFASFEAGAHTPAWIVSFFVDKPFAAIHYLFALSAIVCFSQPPLRVMGLTSGLRPVFASAIFFGPRLLAFLFQGAVTASFLASLTHQARPDIGVYESFSVVALSALTGFATGAGATKVATGVSARFFPGAGTGWLPSASLIIAIAYIAFMSRLPLDLDRLLQAPDVPTGPVSGALSLLLGVAVISRLRFQGPKGSGCTPVRFVPLFRPVALSILLRRCLRSRELVCGLLGSAFSLVLLSIIALAWQEIDPEILILPFAVISSRVQWVILFALRPTLGLRLLCGVRTQHGYGAAAGVGLILMIAVLGVGGLPLVGAAGPAVLPKLFTLALVCWAAVLLFYILSFLWGWRPGEGAALFAGGLACAGLGQTVAGLSDEAVMVRLLACATLGFFLYLILIRYAYPAIERRLVNEVASGS